MLAASLSTTAPAPPTISALNAAVFTSGKLFFEKNAAETVEMASLTKIMTFFCSLKLCDKHSIDCHNTYIQVPRFATLICGTIAALRSGECIKLFDLFHALMLPSGNDAACVLAWFFGSFEVGTKKPQPSTLPLRRITSPTDPSTIFVVYSPENTTATSTPSTTPTTTPSSYMKYFVRYMNLEAAKLQMRSTSFSNPHGLSDKANKSSALDLGRLSYTAMSAFQIFRNVVKTIHHTATTLFLEDSHLRRARDTSWTNTNKLLQTDSRFIGIKTGSTPNAGFCLATHFTKQNINVYVVVLKCRDSERRWTDSQKLAEWTYAVITEQQVLQLPSTPYSSVATSVAPGSLLVQQKEKQPLNQFKITNRSRSALVYSKGYQAQHGATLLPTETSKQLLIPVKQQEQRSILSNSDLDADELLFGEAVSGGGSYFESRQQKSQFELLPNQESDKNKVSSLETISVQQSLKEATSSNSTSSQSVKQTLEGYEVNLNAAGAATQKALTSRSTQLPVSSQQKQILIDSLPQCQQNKRISLNNSSFQSSNNNQGQQQLQPSQSQQQPSRKRNPSKSIRFKMYIAKNSKSMFYVDQLHSEQQLHIQQQQQQSQLNKGLHVQRNLDYMSTLAQEFQVSDLQASEQRIVSNGLQKFKAIRPRTSIIEFHKTSHILFKQPEQNQPLKQRQRNPSIHVERLSKVQKLHLLPSIQQQQQQQSRPQISQVVISNKDSSTVTRMI